MNLILDVDDEELYVRLATIIDGYFKNHSMSDTSCNWCDGIDSVELTLSKQDIREVIKENKSNKMNLANTNILLAIMDNFNKAEIIEVKIR